MNIQPPQIEYPPITEGAHFLFENQDKPFAGDIHLEGEFIKLRDQFGIHTAIETGTCYGSTTLWLAHHFARVFTIEVQEEFAKIAWDRFNAANLKNTPYVWHGSSSEQLPKMMRRDLHPEFFEHEPHLFFLDAHFEQYCPLLDELKAIAEAGIKPVIVIHDFQVPGRPDLGYDIWNGQPLRFSYIRPSLDAIYGPNKYGHYFNHQATGAKRGCIFITPLP